MTYTLSKKFTFEASHQLMHHDGKCARLHGHSWVGWVTINGDKLQSDGPKANMLMDYSELKAAIKPIVENLLDHHHLNDTLATDSPTSEFIATWVWSHLAVALFERAEQARGRLIITIEETCTSRCTYDGG